jgi:membrane protein
MKSRVTMNSNIVKHALLQTYDNVVRNHVLFMAAALSYYFVLSLFPTLILLSAIVAYFPTSNLFNQTYPFMARLLPSESRGLINRVLADVITANRGTFLSLGILGTLWTSSSAFAATIEALNLAYDVRDERPFWKTRLLAVGLAFTTGFSMVVAHSMMIIGPRFGEWIASRVDVSESFIVLWHYLCLTIAPALSCWRSKSCTILLPV